MSSSNLASPISFTDLVAAVGHQTLPAYVRDLSGRLARAFEDFQVDAITSSIVNETLLGPLQHPSYRSALRKIFDGAVRMGIVSSNPAVPRNARLPESEEKRYARSRGYSKKSRLLHREGRLKKWNARRPTADTREFTLALEDLHYEEGHRIREYVICRKCGAKRKRLIHHLLRRHGWLALQYNGPGGRFPGAPLVCAALRHQTSSEQQSIKRKLRHRSRRSEMSGVRGHSKEKPVKRWDVVRLIWNCKTPGEIARILNRHPHLVRRIAYGLGFARTTPRRHDLGRPIVRSYVDTLVRALGLDRSSFEHMLRLPSTSGRASSPDFLAMPANAVLVIAERDRFISELAKIARTNRRGGPNTARAMKALFPDFHQIAGSLRRVLVRCREFLRQRPEANIEDLRDWICDKAWSETAAKSDRGKLFTGFLHFAPEISDLVDLSSVRAKGPISDVAAQILARRFGVGKSVIVQCEYSRPLPPGDMRSWFLRLPSQALKAPPGPGRPAERTETFLEAKILRDRGISWPEIAKRLDPHAADRKAAGERIRLGVDSLKKS